MSRYRRTHNKGTSYFFTVVTYRRQQILCDLQIRTALRQAIKTVREKYPFKIEAWVLLPDHLHCIWTLPPDDVNYSFRWGMIKRLVSRACAKDYKRHDWINASKRKHRESTIWQRRYWEHQIRNEQDFARHVDYIHYNPVKHGICNRVMDWPYSTFHREVARGIYTEDWAGDKTKPVGGDFGE